MEKKSLSQQTADRLYTMIVVERRLSPGEKLPSELDLSRELAKRPSAWVCPEPRVKTGYLARYAKMVTSADKGAILDF